MRMFLHKYYQFLKKKSDNAKLSNHLSDSLVFKQKILEKPVRAHKMLTVMSVGLMCVVLSELSICHTVIFVLQVC